MLNFHVIKNAQPGATSQVLFTPAEEAAAVSWAFGAGRGDGVSSFSQVTAAGLMSHASGNGATASTPTANGTSTYGGNGGLWGGAGVIPGGGGAGTTSGTTGAGARDRLIVRTF